MIPFVVKCGCAASPSSAKRLGTSGIPEAHYCLILGPVHEAKSSYHTTAGAELWHRRIGPYNPYGVFKVAFNTAILRPYPSLIEACCCLFLPSTEEKVQQAEAIPET